MYISSWSVLKTLTYIREGNKSFVGKKYICRKTGVLERTASFLIRIILVLACFCFTDPVFKVRARKTLQVHKMQVIR